MINSTLELYPHSGVRCSQTALVSMNKQCHAAGRSSWIKVQRSEGSQSNVIKCH